MSEQTSERRSGARYQPGQPISIEVEGYAEPFRFAVKLRDFQKLQRATGKNLAVHTANFLKDTSLDWERLAPLLDEDSPEFDMTLQPVLLSELMAEIGLAREAAVKKP